MKIYAKEILKNFKGETLKDQEEDITLGVAIANILLGSSTGGKMKMFILAEKFYNDENVTLDVSDLAMVKKAVETTEVYLNNLVPGQVLIALEKVVEAKE